MGVLVWVFKSRLEDRQLGAGIDARKQRWGRECWREKGGKPVQEVLMSWLLLRPSGSLSCWAPPDFTSELSCQGIRKLNIYPLTLLLVEGCPWGLSSFPHREKALRLRNKERPGPPQSGSLSAIEGTVLCSCRWTHIWARAAIVSALLFVSIHGYYGGFNITSANSWHTSHSEMGICSFFLLNTGRLGDCFDQ